MSLARVRSLAGERTALPAQVTADLAAALAACRCRQRHRHATPCADCAASGRILAPAVGAALLVARIRGRPLTAEDYDVIGRSIERLEALAGTARPLLQVRGRDRGEPRRP
jgi:hypothetical protein